LEELAAIFGDDDEIVVYMKDIHVDHTTHQLVVDKQRGTAEFGRVVTELHPELHPAGKMKPEHEEGSQTEKDVSVGAESV